MTLELAALPLVRRALWLEPKQLEYKPLPGGVSPAA